MLNHVQAPVEFEFVRKGRSRSTRLVQTNSIVLSEAAVKVMGIPHPVGETVHFGPQEDPNKDTVNKSKASIIYNNKFS